MSPMPPKKPTGDPALKRLVQNQLDDLRQALRRVLDFSGLTNREIQQRLARGGCGTHLTPILKGQQGLRFKDVLAICYVIELDPVDFLLLALNQAARPKRSPFLQRLYGLLPYAVDPEGKLAIPPRPADVADLLNRARDLGRRLDHFVREAARVAAAEPDRDASPRTRPR